MKKSLIIILISLSIIAAISNVFDKTSPLPTVQEKRLSLTELPMEKEKADSTLKECKNTSAGEFTRCWIKTAYCQYKPKVNGKPTFCNDAPYPRDTFTFLVWDEDLSYYNGKCLVVSGFVKWYKGKLEIEGDPSTVTLCE